jgi:transcriptional regulator with XRE-family HTH domain
MPADKAAVGTRLRAAREERGWSREALATRLRAASEEELPAVVSLAHMIKEWEAGKHGVSERYRVLYCRVFGMSEAELFERHALERRPYDAQSGSLFEALTSDLSSRVVALGRDRAATVDDLSARVHALRLADDVLAGGDLLSPAFRELDAATSLYRSSSRGEVDDCRLLSLIGEFAQIAGWVASDAGQYGRAAETYELGISAARQAGDGALESNLTGSLAYQIANVGDPDEAVPLAEAALEAAGPDAPARARALAWDRLAWTHAKAQDAKAAMRALGEASAALAERDSEPDPPYLYWVNSGELQIMEARAYTELHRPLRAVPLLVEVLDRYDATRTRELTLYLSWLAVALADANEPEEAASVARRMLELGADVASERTAQRERVVLARLESYSDVPMVQEVLRSAR